MNWSKSPSGVITAIGEGFHFHIFIDSIAWVYIDGCRVMIPLVFDSKERAIEELAEAFR